MRRHAPMWEAELGGDDGINDIDVHARKFHDDMEEYDAKTSGIASWSQLLIFLGAAAAFMTIVLNWKPGA